MAYDFGGLTSRYLNSSSPSTVAYPSTISVWTYITSVAATSVPVSWHYQISTTNYAIIRLAYGASGAARARISVFSYTTSAFSASVDTTNTFTLNSWNHICIVLLNTTSRTVYLNGNVASAGSSTTNVPLSGMDTVRIGTSIDTAGNNAVQTYGRISDVALWSTNLNTSEINSLSKGFSAYKVRPQSLIYHAPMIRDLIEYKGQRTITNNGSTPVANHNRIYL